MPAAAQPARPLREPALHSTRHLQLVDAEHRQRQRCKQQREAAQHPGVLQRGGQALAHQPGQQAEAGVDERHAQRIGQRQREAPGPRHHAGLADDDRRQDRDHRQHAGRERQQQPGEQERAGHLPQAARLQHRVEGTGGCRGRCGLGCSLRCGLGHQRLRWHQRGGRRSTARRLGQPARRIVGCQHHSLRQRAGNGLHLHHVLHRRVAQALVGAALVGDHPVRGCRRPGRQLDNHLHLVAKDLHLLAEVRVELALAARQLQLGAGRCAVDGELLPVEVVAGGDVEAQLHAPAVEGAGRQPEGLLGVEEIIGRRLGSAGQGGHAQKHRQARHGPCRQAAEQACVEELGRIHRFSLSGSFEPWSSASSRWTSPWLSTAR